MVIKLPDKWDLTHLFSSPLAWQDEFKSVKEAVGEMAAWEEKGIATGKDFFTYLQHSESVELRLEQLYQYAHLQHTLDTASVQGLEMVAQAEWMYSQYSQNTSFFLPAFNQIPPAVLAEWLVEYPQARHYQRMIEVLNRQRPYILSDKEERLLAQSGEAMATVASAYNQLANADLTFKSVTDAHGKRHRVDEAVFTLLARSPDRQLRQKAFASLTGTYYTHRNSLAQLLTGNAKTDEFVAQARGYDSTLAAKLYQDELTPAFYDDLLASVGKLLPLSNAYVEVKKQFLNL